MLLFHECVGTYYIDTPMKEIEKPLKSNNMVENVGAWYAEFIDMDDTSLYKLVNAANYLMIQPLLDLAYPFPCYSNKVPLFALALRLHPILREKQLKRFANVSTLLAILPPKRKRE